MLKNRNFGIGFGGSNKTDCRLWIDQNLGGNCYINYRDANYFDGSLLYSLDKVIKEVYQEDEAGPRQVNGQPVGRPEQKEAGEQDASRREKWVRRGITQKTFKDLKLDLVGVEIWALMTPEAYARYNHRLSQMSTFSHYDKMIGLNYEVGNNEAQFHAPLQNRYSNQ